MQQQDKQILYALNYGKIEIKGEFIWGSNYTFLTQIRFDQESLLAVYKPNKGEKPLWDFPRESLSKREVAAYEVSEALNWRLVPPTTIRHDAPYGTGSLQLFINHNPNNHYFVLSDDDKNRLKPIVVFDLAINNADRKGSHIILDDTNHLWGIDHGVCFHIEDKIRTVIWDFSGTEIPDHLIKDLIRVNNLIIRNNNSPQNLYRILNQYLSDDEINMLKLRIENLLETKQFPFPKSDRRSFPWPLL